MFKRDKGVKEYMNAIEKVKLPSIKGEEYITKNEQKYKSKIKISSIMITAASLCVIFLVTTFGSNLLQNKDVENKKIPFAITAYAGTQEVKLEENRAINLPSGFIKDGVFNMQGLYIEGDDIEKIGVKYDSGNIAYAATKNCKEKIYQDISISDSSMLLGMGTSETDRPGMTVQYKENSVIDEVLKVEGFSTGTVQKDTTDRIPADYSIDKLQQESSIFGAITNPSDTNVEFHATEGSSKHYITWIPEKEFLKKLCTNNIDDFSKEQGCVMNITVTFKDGITLEKTLNLTFGKAGNLIVELK